MKRFASHYLYLMGYGFLKRYVVEVNDDGFVSCLFPLEVETESIAWSPGVIALIPYSLMKEKNNGRMDANRKQEIIHTIFEPGTNDIRQDLPGTFNSNIAWLELIAVRLYPFDFTSMHSLSDTSVQMLDKHTF